ncbi:MAG: beta-ketoacyl-ACP synthase II [bacterium]|nr:beta-ketoacyl-ACP synthase II [bacterium]
MRKVVITGIGTVNPAGNNIPEFKKNLYDGKCCIALSEDLAAEEFPVKVCGKINGFNPENYFDKKEIRRMDRFIQIAVVSAIEALQDSGSDFSDIDKYRCGIITGVGFGGLPHTEVEHEKFLKKGGRFVSPLYIPSMISNMAAGTIAIKTGFKGTNFSISTACASSTHAIGEAFRKIKDGYMDMCLCGGSEACLTKYCLSGFNNMKALTNSDNPYRASIPFDSERNGFVLGEGGAMLVLEEYEHARKRGTKIYAEIAGYGATCDAYHITMPEPSADAVCAAILSAIQEADMPMDNVDYINAHGTSTLFNDKTESLAINKVFKSHAKDIYVNSTKSITGHMLGGAGAVEACATALQMKYEFVHPTAGYRIPDPECDINVVNNRSVDAEIKGALSVSLGFGGHNGVLCFNKV